MSCRSLRPERRPLSRRIWTRSDGPLPWKAWFHNLLEGAHPDQNGKTAIDGICVPGREFHALRGKDNRPVPVEPLSLRTWIAISGSDFPTGLRLQLSKPLALLLGLANVRLGYWWDTRLEAGDRPGRFTESFLRRLKRFPARVVRRQYLLLTGFRARFQVRATATGIFLTAVISISPASTNCFAAACR
jgi:hypothetical protein